MFTRTFEFSVSLLHSLVHFRMKTYTFWDTLHVLYRFIKAWGYISFSIDGKIEKGRIKSTVWDVLFVAAYNLLLCYIIYVNVVYDLTLISTKTFLIDKATRLISIAMVSNVILSGFINTARRYKIWKIHRTFHDFDIEVS